MIEESKLKEFASILDSKGSITIGLDNTGGKGYYYEQIRITGTEEELECFKSVFGGSVSGNGRRCDSIWRATSDIARNFFVQIREHSMERREEIDVCLKFGKARQEASQTSDKTGLRELAEESREKLEELKS